MSKVYVFSGLGVDRRVFDEVDFGDLQVEFVDWILPEKDEPLQKYALRISGVITTENPILIGLSFGGMVAVEISKIISIRKIILIASAANAKELPVLYRCIGSLNVHKVIPLSLLKKRNALTDWFFGIRSKREQSLLDVILKDTDPLFLRWALDAVLKWKTACSDADIFHIHGNQDHILPLKYVKADYVVKGGGHFMTVNKAEEISIILRKVCRELT